MDKRKHKLTPSQQNQHLAELHNKHKKAVHEYIKSVGLEGGIHAIPAHLQKYFFAHFNFPKFLETPNDDDEYKYALKFANGTFLKLCALFFIEVNAKIPKLSLKEYLTFDFQFTQMLRYLEMNNLADVSDINEKLKEYIDDSNRRYNNYLYYINAAAVETIKTMNGSIAGVYWMHKKEGGTNSRGKPQLFNFELYRKEREITHLQKEKSRVFRMCNAKNDATFSFTDLCPTEIGFLGKWSKKPYPVYIREHAIERLLERLDTETQESIVHYLNISFEKKVIKILSKGDASMEFYLLDKKVGYLKLGFEDSKVIIKTFLFITNSGTPEGDKLNKMLGLQKMDKQYWNIDRISVFEMSDIEANAELKNIFIEAGCNSLFELKQLSRDMRSELKPLKIADMLTNFLHKTQEMEGWAVDEE